MDVASQKDNRGVFLDEVGIRNVRIPIKVKDRSTKREQQYTIGTFDAFVGLDTEQRGTHMSRIVECIYNNRDNINQAGLAHLCQDLCEKLETTSSVVHVGFPYFLDRYSPESHLHNLMVYQGWFLGELTQAGFNFQLGVKVDIMSVCPCALAECGNGNSHVQRGEVNINVQPRSDEWIWLEELIDIAETAGCSPLYERLKRPDEKAVVLNGFKNPKFVEDIVRDIVVALKENKRVDNYRVSCENFESIHQHNAYARAYND